MARGLSDTEIAQQLVVSRHTVHRHVANVRVKRACPRVRPPWAQAARAGLL